MRTWGLPVLISLLIWIPVINMANVFAMDVSGCLTCHQYPGLARPEPSGGFKVFHIDENRYLQSPHGGTQCRECHTVVEKVPHVGDTAVNCTNGCHVPEKDKKMIANFPMKTLHDMEKSHITRLEDGSSCSVCHRLYPHTSSELARAFINMHIGFMTCETCHINRDKFQPLFYDWTSSESADFKGEPFGTRFNPNLGKDAKSTHFISRISVFSSKEGEKRSLVNTRDTSEAKAFLDTEAQLTPEEKEKRLEYFHRDIHKAQISVTCNECHAKDSILDFRQLGFSEKKGKDLKYLNIKGLVTKYEVFYFPHMLDR